MVRWKDIALSVATLADAKFSRRKDLADLLQEDESNVSNWLRGARTPELDSALRLVEAVGGKWGKLVDDYPAASASEGLVSEASQAKEPKPEASPATLADVNAIVAAAIDRQTERLAELLRKPRSGVHAAFRPRGKAGGTEGGR